MLFNSLPFILLLVITVTLYWRLRHSGQNWLLLAASYLFYGWWDYRFLYKWIGTVTATPLHRIRGTDQFDAALRAGFLPDILDAMSPFPGFFLVECHARPDPLNNDRINRYRQHLHAYLADRQVPVIQLQANSELDDPRMWGIGHHLTPAGRDLNTRYAAAAFLRSGVLARKHSSSEPPVPSRP